MLVLALPLYLVVVVVVVGFCFLFSMVCDRLPGLGASWAASVSMSYLSHRVPAL